MQFSVSSILDMTPALNALMNLTGLPGKAVFDLCLFKEHAQSYIDAYNAAQLQLLKKHATPVDGQPGNFSWLIDSSDGKQKVINTAAQQAYNDENNGLLNGSIDIPDGIIPTVFIEDVCGPDGKCHLTAHQLMALRTIVKQKPVEGKTTPEPANKEKLP